jgi:Na+/phosphate symporter
MITGSRLGASFIVLFIGFIYVLRGRNRGTSLSMGLLSLIITGVTHLVGLPVGLLLLRAGWLDGVQLESGALLLSITELIFEPAVAMFLTFLPRWGLFLVGFGIILASFSLFDKCLPQMSLRESQVGQISRLVYQPWVMLALGAGITLISMSVSVSLSILVPLSQRGFVRRENVIPYILGANITTFVDTLLAAVLLNNPEAFTVVLIEMLSISIVSFLILALFYDYFQEKMLDLVNGITANNRNLAIFMSVILIVPVILLVL